MALDLALRLARGNCLALVVLVLPSRQTKLDLSPSMLEIELHRHQRVPLLAHLPDEGVELLSMEQQFSIAQRFMVEPRAVLVGSDVYAD